MAQQHPATSARPRTIQELGEAAQFRFDQSLSLMSYVRGAENLRRQATVYEKEQDYETAFVLLTRSAKLALDHIPKHKDFGQADKDVASRLVKTSRLSMEDMRRLKPRLKERYEQWKTVNDSSSAPSSQSAGSQTSSSSSVPYIPYTPPTSSSSSRPTFAAPAQPANTSSSAFHTPFIPYLPPPSPLPSHHLVSQSISYPKIPNAGPSRPSSNADIGGFYAPAPAPIQTNAHRQEEARPLQPSFRAQTIAALKPSWTEGGMPLRNMVLPASIMETFAAVALKNTQKNLETCGLIMGKLARNVFTATTLLIPKQTATSDTCSTTNEEDIFAISDSRDLIVLGWIHTHPRQTCFLSSVDLHTHHSYQQMLPEAIAIVVAPTASPSIGIFRMTDPLGLQVIGTCTQPGLFHPHPDLPIYTDANGMHVSMDPTLRISVIDVR